MLKIFKQIGLWLIWLYKFIVQLLILFIKMILNISFKRTLYMHDYTWTTYEANGILLKHQTTQQTDLKIL